MPCKTCRSITIYIEDIKTCPKCDSVQLVPYDDSLKIVNFIIEKYEKALNAEIKKYTKADIVVNAFWQREKLILKIFDKYSILDIERIACCNLIIRRTMHKNGFLKKEIDEKKIEEIINAYGGLLKYEQNRSCLKAGTWNMIKMAKYDLNHLDKLNINEILIVDNEKYRPIIKTFGKHNVMTEKKAEEKLAKWKQEFTMPVRGSNRIRSSTKTITKFYELISTLYTVFFRSETYYEAFGFSNAGKISITPIKIKEFMAEYDFHRDRPTSIRLQDFKKNVIAKFGGKHRQFFDNFVLSENNISANPLFIEFENKVFIAHAFINFYGYVLHAIIDKEEFDKETNRRSKIFESQIVKEHFEKQGFEYISNRKVNNVMEIDGIAISKDVVYVIEVKGWGSKKFIEESTKNTILDREIKDSIDGTHRNVDSGKIRKLVPLPEKVEWVRKNRTRLGINNNAEITGALVINEFPTITEYQTCKIFFINDFEYTE